jgi:hypothetical protein
MVQMHNGHNDRRIIFSLLFSLAGRKGQRTDGFELFCMHRLSDELHDEHQEFILSIMLFIVSINGGVH